MDKNKKCISNILVKKSTIIAIFLIIFILFFSASKPFANLTINQRIILAQAYYKVALYYYNNNNKEKGDAFKSVAHYLDPNFEPREINLSKPLSEEEVEKLIEKTKENALNFVKEFFKSSEKSYLSYPVYNLASADLFSEETIDVLLEIDIIKQFFGKIVEVKKVEYEKAKNLSSFLPLVYMEEDDLIYLIQEENKENMVIILIRNFGFELKIIGLLPLKTNPLNK